MPAEYDYLTEDKVWQKVTGELWRWRAIYENGSVLHQFNDATGRFHRFAEIDQSRLIRFEMYSNFHTHIYAFNFPQGAKLVHKYIKGRIQVPLENDEVFNYDYQFWVFGYDKQILSIDRKGNTYFGDNVTGFAQEQAQAKALEKKRQAR
jgi:hypothetical protein